MAILHENFNRDHGILRLIGAPTDMNFVFDGGSLSTEKLTKTWNTGGFQSIANINFDLHDAFELRFSPQTNRVGTDGEATYYTLGIIADKVPGELNQSSYGIYVEGGTIKLQNGPSIGDFGPIQVNKNYTLRLTPNEASELRVHLTGPGISPVHVGNLAGPFLNRQVMFQFNCFSQDTLLFKDYMFTGSL